MKKKLTFWSFALITFAAFSFCLAFVGRLANEKRNYLAEHYSYQASQTKDLRARNLWLIKSDTLAPAKDKKVQIALNFFQLNEPLKARGALYFAASEQANYLLAQYYLFNQTSEARYYIEKITDPKINGELQTALAISQGNPFPPESLRQPKSDVAIVLTAGDLGTDLNKVDSPYLEGWIMNLSPSSGTVNQTLNIAEWFLQNQQPRFALYVLSTLDESVGTLAPSSTLKAKSSAALHDYSEALRYQSQTIALTPENIEAYQTGIIYARKAGDSSRLDFWSARAQELQILQK